MIPFASSFAASNQSSSHLDSELWESIVLGGAANSTPFSERSSFHVWFECGHIQNMWSKVSSLPHATQNTPCLIFLLPGSSPTANPFFISRHTWILALGGALVFH